ncbi:uncharacterized protein CIMG_09205 [Coccidioides immitis RS]|uniref:Uncharacterized protein n=1 Tax=Coccidioides immitis (strain RS) TaxID=246410 RepID=J3K1U9_COCIM|nr:uncharacterized protein CIMG_09205 [Coccidioides immitis RS]EAS28001.3 hypothetical protein CIMG_09205 [Coccidioides immitis RS]
MANSWDLDEIFANMSLPLKEKTWCLILKALLLISKTEDTFRHNMEEPEHEMAELAFELFDQFGCFQSQSKKHPVKRGWGVWSDEPNNRNTILIEELTISPTHQQQGIGPRLACAVQELASEKSGKFVGIILLAGSGIRPMNSTQVALYHLDRILTCLASRGCLLYRRLTFLIKALPTIDDPECLTRLGNIFGDAFLDDTRWEATDEDGNTLLHLRDSGLLSQRNAHGNTPVEVMEASMERKRIIYEHGFKRTDISDQFTGYDDVTISCLTMLRGLVLKQILEA